ncbi:LLM class flavin-dependent oxidoreductase, partial [Ilumatobacter sp.]|uniref:LLM class flavin-dependent oxidoreductase n=1 Tax=Ilumatobacter sp. TaxID=1967498 RepID=UPI003C443A74
MSWRNIDTSSRRAIVFTPLETRREVLVEAAVHAEHLGYEAVIIPEGWALDASVVLAEIALRTERITLVAGILSVWNRSPATIAMTAATLDDVSGGRFVLGLGASTAALAEGLHGVAFRAPGTKLRTTIAEVRALLNGERASTSHAARGLRLGQSPRPELPIWVAGLGPRSVVS